MNDTMWLAVGILLAVGVSLVTIKINARKRADSWSGTVTGIRRYRVQVDDTDEEKVEISYCTDAGKKGKLMFNPTAFNKSYPDLKVGDQLVKEPGEYAPKQRS